MGGAYRRTPIWRNPIWRDRILARILTELKLILARILTELVFNFTGCFLRFFSIWRVWRIWRSGEEVQGTSSGAAEVPWTSSRTLLGTGNWGEVGRGRDTMNAKNYIQVYVGGGVGLGGDSTNSKKSLFSEYDL